MEGLGSQCSLAPAGLLHCIDDQCLFNAASDSEQGHDGKTENGNQMQFPWQHPQKMGEWLGVGRIKKKKKEGKKRSLTEILGFTHQ